jgi:hypothetical protein
MLRTCSDPRVFVVHRDGVAARKSSVFHFTKRDNPVSCAELTGLSAAQTTLRDSRS